MKNYNLSDMKKPSTFTANNYDTKITVEIDHSDLDLDEVMDAFQTLLNGMGFHADGFKNWVLDRADEYRQEDIDNENDKISFEDEDIEIRHSNSHFNDYTPSNDFISSKRDAAEFYDKIMNHPYPSDELIAAAKKYSDKFKGK